MRPTGRLHLGNYMGALKNWVALQSETNLDGTPTYDCYFFIADYHALTTDYADTSKLQQNVRDVALDFLSAGLDPALCTLFIQSHVPAHFELNDLLAMITPLSWLERVPSYKDQQEQLKEKDLATFGFLGYPLLQSADILAYQPDFVPVGQDQAAHVEFTRELARRFNYLYSNRGFKALAQLASQGTVSGYEALARLGASSSTGFPAIGALLGNADQPLDEKRGRLGSGGYPDPADTVPARSEILPEPKVLLTPSPKLPGTDGRKMSKSYNNTILLSDPEPDIRAKLKTMVTDPARIRRTDPGNPDVCPVFDLHKVFSTAETQAEVRTGCTTAGIGCIQCKGWLADAVVKELAPIQQRRAHFESHPAEVAAIFEAGNAAANIRANQTMQEVRVAMGLR
jgi:tryptophanyl-tRNA synthetase